MSTIDRRTAGAGEPYYTEGMEGVIAGSGWLVFGALLILFTGIWNIIEGFIASFRSAFFIGAPVFGALWAWGLVLIGVGVLEVAAGYGILGGRTWARWFGIGIVSISALTHMFAIATYPWWSLFILAIDVVILYALAVQWPRKTAAAAGG